MPIVLFKYADDIEEIEMEFGDINQAVTFAESLSDIEYADITDDEGEILWDHISGVIDQ